VDGIRSELTGIGGHAESPSSSTYGSPILFAESPELRVDSITLEDKVPNEINDAIIEKFGKNKLHESFGDELPNSRFETQSLLSGLHMSGNPHATEILAWFHHKGKFDFKQDKKLAQELFEKTGLHYSKYKLARKTEEENPEAALKLYQSIISDEHSDEVMKQRAHYRLKSMQLHSEDDVLSKDAIADLVDIAYGGQSKSLSALNTLARHHDYVLDQKDMAIAYYEEPSQAPSKKFANAALLRIAKLTGVTPRRPGGEIDSFHQIDSVNALEEVVNRDALASPEGLQAFKNLVQKAREHNEHALTAVAFMHFEKPEVFGRKDKFVHKIMSQIVVRKSHPRKAEALFAIAKLYMQNRAGLKSDRAQENEYLRRSALMGDSSARTEFALRSLSDKFGLEKNLPMAFRLFYQSRKGKEKSTALYHLGDAFEKGWGGAKIDLDTSHYYYNLAAKAKNPDAMQKMKELEIDQASGTNKYSPEHETLLAQGVVDNSSYALYRRGIQYFEGLDGKPDLAPSGKAFLNRAINTDIHHPNLKAMWYLADKAKDGVVGVGVSYHDVNHKMLYVESAKLGFVQSQLDLGRYLAGGRYEFEKDTKRAVEWLLTALKRLPDNQANAENYNTVLGVLHKLSEDGDPHASLALAEIFETGAFEYPRDVHKAAQYILKCDDGSDKAIHKHALILLNGIPPNAQGFSVEKDPEKAIDLLKTLVSENYVPAKVTLGLEYLKQDVSKHLDGLILLKEAREAGDLNAFYQTGELYLKGDTNHFSNDERGNYDIHYAAKNGLAVAQGAWAARLLNYPEKDRAMEDIEMEAVGWAERGAAQNDANSLYILYTLQKFNRGGLDAESELLYGNNLQLAAHAGHSQANYDLAIELEEDTKNLEENKARIIELLQQAKAAGHEDAAGKLIGMGITDKSAVA
jgi:TPR repeat protein